MTNDRSELRKYLALGKMSVDEFNKLYFNGIDSSRGEFSELIQNGIGTKNSEEIEEAMFLISVGRIDTNEWISELCFLLKENWHYEHENIASFLQAAKNPLAIDDLFVAAQMQFAYLAYDVTFQFGRKCIKALSAIGNENAVSKLKQLARSSHSEIAHYAHLEVNRLTGS